MNPERDLVLNLKDNPQVRFLILVRHGLSEWNKLGLWTGWTDIPLAEEGVEEARRVASQLKEVALYSVHSSRLTRSKQTLSIILENISPQDLLVIKRSEAIKERNYGIYAGKNKWQVRDELGEEEFIKLRRSWDHPVPEGESFKQVYERTTPYLQNDVFEDLKMGHVLISSHSNPLRAIVAYLENIPPEEVSEIEVGTGEAHIYVFDLEMNPIAKEIRAENLKKGKI